MAEIIDEELSENNESDADKKAYNQKVARIKVSVAAVCYTFMAFIVIYGMSDGVYNGFPGWVPYIIVTIFLIMSFVRMYQGISGDIPEKKKKKFSLFGRNDEESADEESEDEE